MFVDTGGFLARHLAGDQHHKSAVRYWKKIEKENARLFTSNLVLNEFFTLLGRRAGHCFAAARARAVYASRQLEILRPGAEEEKAAVKLFEKYADLRVTFTDCVSFVLMRRERLTSVFGFDSHFEIVGFRRMPGT